MSPSKAKKRYLTNTAVSMGVYLAATFGATFFIRGFEPPEILKYVIAFLPALCVWWFMWGAYRFYQETDEFERSRLITGMLIGIMFILVVTSGYGFLELLADAPHISLFWVFPAFCFAGGIGRYFTKIQGERC